MRFFWMSLLNIPRYPISTAANCVFSSRRIVSKTSTEGTFEVQHAMSRERFQEIWMNLKIYDGVSYPDDPTKLVRPLLVRLSYIFESQLIMGDEKSIDEIMIGYSEEAVQAEKWT